jgi:hypothetical protein
LLKEAFIRKTPSGKWRILSEKGKTLGEYDTKEKAVSRLRQIEYFKHHPKKKKASKNNDAIDLSHLKELTYSAIMRELRQENEKIAEDFATIFKQLFDEFYLISCEEPEEFALTLSVIALNNLHPLNLKKEKEND